MKDKQTRRAHSDHRWNLRSCARHGHLTYAVTEPDLRERLRADTAQGEAWRCLRCGSYALGLTHGEGPADQAPTPLRGRALRDAFVMRLLAIERFVRGIFLLIFAYAVYKFDGAKNSIHRVFNEDFPAVQQFANKFNIDITDAAPTRWVNKAFDAHHTTLVLIAGGLLAYGLLEILEGVGLWVMQRWGEYVAVVGTSIFLPYEIYEMSDKFSAFKLVLFLVNVAAVVWLIWTKRLFGARGGAAAYEKQRESESLIDVERAAAA